MTARRLTWRFTHPPVRKVFYNVVIIGLSVAVALAIGTIEPSGVHAAQFRLHGVLWDNMAKFDINTAWLHNRGPFVVTCRRTVHLAFRADRDSPGRGGHYQAIDR